MTTSTRAHLSHLGFLRFGNLDAAGPTFYKADLSFGRDPIEGVSRRGGSHCLS